MLNCLILDILSLCNQIQRPFAGYSKCLVGVSTWASELKQDTTHSPSHAANVQHEALGHKHLYFPAVRTSLTNPKGKNPCKLFVTELFWSQIIELIPLCGYQCGLPLYCFNMCLSEVQTIERINACMCFYLKQTERSEVKCLPSSQYSKIMSELQVCWVLWHVSIFSGFIMVSLDLIKNLAPILFALKTVNLVMSLSKTIWALALIATSMPGHVRNGF